MAPFKNWLLNTFIRPVHNKMIKTAARYVVNNGGSFTQPQLSNSSSSSSSFNSRTRSFLKNKSNQHILEASASTSASASATNNVYNNNSKMNNNNNNNNNNSPYIHKRRGSRNNGLQSLREARIKKAQMDKDEKLRTQLSAKRTRQIQQSRSNLTKSKTSNDNNNNNNRQNSSNNNNRQTLSSSNNPTTKITTNSNKPSTGTGGGFKRCYYVPVMNPLPDLKDKQLTVLDTHLYGIRDIDFLKHDSNKNNMHSNNRLPQSVIDTAGIRDLEIYKMNDMLNTFLNDSNEFLSGSENQNKKGELGDLDIEEIDDTEDGGNKNISSSA